MEIEKIVSKIISDLIKNRDHQKDNWNEHSKYLLIKNLNNDETGEVGELLLQDIFTRNGHKVEYEKAVTSEDKDWDIIIDDIKIEVKTATIGRTAKTFQHEKFFKNRNYDAFIFFDFTPNELYVTIGRKKDIVWKKLTKRMVNGVFTSEYKFDLSLKMIEEGKTKKIKDCCVSLINDEEDLLDLFDKFKKKLVKIN
ncbi:MAG: hypothetical protein CEN87_233 [Parcubacteria group bacterium Licking1014_1]|nr:MAG: hypothetical protein CEN87_233 [Parcubacteria group bacterium Licking1014_1]